MVDTMVLIFDEDSFKSIFTDSNQMDYYDYLAKMYHEMEQYKHNFINFLEYVVTKQELDIFIEENKLTYSDLEKDVSLCLKMSFNLDMSKTKSYVRVPDYMLKTIETMVLPIRIMSSSDSNKLLFNTLTLNHETTSEISKIFNQYLFSDFQVEKIRPSLMTGQEHYISPHLLNFNTYAENQYHIKFENIINKNTEEVIHPCFHDEIYRHEKEGKFFVVKLLHMYFEGSSYEFRNFLYKNPHYLANVTDCIQRDLDQKYPNEFIVEPTVDRFAIVSDIDNIYSYIQDLYPYMQLYKDTDTNNYKLPHDFYGIDPTTLKYKNNTILLSNFTSQKVMPSSQKVSKSKNNKKVKENDDIDRLREIHYKKFPNIPFPYDNNNKNS